ncbi:MAG: ChbG/HpnK family deacetylase [Acidobacteriia bacterium]|nr:ChbG/HpnK family deacetylase [Terriglobia bacterium]
MPSLIINADDFGMTSGVNRAIADATRAGLLTSATMMANSRCFDDAVELSRKLPNLRVGCHVVLIDGEPVSHGLRSLLEPGHDGPPRFRHSLKAFALAAMRGKIAPEEIQQEAEAQIRRIQAAGIVVTHVDTHKHTHMFPNVLRPVLRAAKACGVRRVRNPFEASGSLPASLIAGAPSLWTRTAEVALLRGYAVSFRKIVQQEGMTTTQGAIGVIVTGMLDQKLLTKMVQRLSEGTWELVCHPGYVDDALRSSGTRLVESRQVELQALTSEETRQALSSRGIQLVSFADLKEM